MSEDKNAPVKECAYQRAARNLVQSDSRRGSPQGLLAEILKLQVLVAGTEHPDVIVAEAEAEEAHKAQLRNAPVITANDAVTAENEMLKRRLALLEGSLGALLEKKAAADAAPKQ